MLAREGTIQPHLSPGSQVLLQTMAPAIAVLICNVAVDTPRRHIIISGRNLGSTSPSVKLGGQILAVMSFSPNQAVTGLPASIHSARTFLRSAMSGIPTSLMLFMWGYLAPRLQ